MIESPINYMGSKYALLDRLIPLFPKRKETFIDLFTGGGSVYMNVCQYYQSVIANDILTQLIGIHQRLESRYFIDEASMLRRATKHCQEIYVALRESFNQDPSPEKLLALIWSCNSNMMRFNQAFQFNQTWGQRSCNANTMKKWHHFCQKDYSNVLFTNLSFDAFDFSLYEDVFVYLDPPYSNTEAGYNAFWTTTHERNLIALLHRFLDEGISFGLSGVCNGKPNPVFDAFFRDERIKVFYFEDLYQKISKKEKVNQEYYLTNDYDLPLSISLFGDNT